MSSRSICSYDANRVDQEPAVRVRAPEADRWQTRGDYRFRKRREFVEEQASLRGAAPNLASLEIEWEKHWRLRPMGCLRVGVLAAVGFFVGEPDRAGRLGLLAGLALGFLIEAGIWLWERRRHPTARLVVTRDKLEFDDGATHEVMARSNEIEIRTWEKALQVVVHVPGRVVVLRESHDEHELTQLVDLVREFGD